MHNKQNSPLWNMRVIALTMSFLVVLFVYLVWDVMARPSLREATDHLLEQARSSVVVVSSSHIAVLTCL